MQASLLPFNSEDLEACCGSSLYGANLPARPTYCAETSDEIHRGRFWDLEGLPAELIGPGGLSGQNSHEVGHSQHPASRHGDIISKLVMGI